MSEMDILFPVPDGRRNADDMGLPPAQAAPAPSAERTSPYCTCDYGDDRGMIAHAAHCDFALGKPAAQPAELLGMKVVADPAIPAGEVRLMQDGQIVGRIVDAAPADPPATDDLVRRLKQLWLPLPVNHASITTLMDATALIERQAREIESLRAECGLRQIQGYNEGKEAASARLYEAEAEQLTRDMRQRAERAEALAALRLEWYAKACAERDALRAEFGNLAAILRVNILRLEPKATHADIDAIIDAARARVRT